MLHAASIYTKGKDRHRNNKDMIMVMLKAARISLKMLGSDIIEQLSKRQTLIISIVASMKSEK